MPPILHFAVAVLGLSLHHSSASSEADQIPLESAAADGTQTFTLRHLFYHDLQILRNGPAAFTSIASLQNSIHPSAFDTAALTTPFQIRATRDTTSPKDVVSSSIASSKTIPNMTDKATIVNLAIMTSDVYYLNSTIAGWLNLTQGYKDSLGFGYEKPSLRGHLFTNTDNTTVIVSFKGSSIDPREKTRTEDRLNDNLLFSCCCAAQRPDPYWYGEVCQCREDVYRCNSTCLSDELVQSDRYYAAAIGIMTNITRDLYPNASIWTTGHSLGGSIASLMGLKFSAPAISFEAPPDRLAARRLGLVNPKIKQKSPTWHVGNTADPVYMGACNGFYSTCALAGYSFESQCFTGKRCIYDTVGDKGWHMNVANHRINTVITDVLEKYEAVPECVDEEDECADCFLWSYD